MIQPNELRIGNWVSYGQHIVQIVAVIENGFIKTKPALDGFCDEYNPIHLTPEVLEKCGFKKDGKYNSADRYTSKSPIILFAGNGSFILCHYPTCEIKHLHQLQNLYFALTGEELEYKP